MNSMRRPIGWIASQVEVILVALLAVIATGPFGRLFYGYGFLAAVAVGALLPVMVVGAVRRRSWLWTPALNVIGVAVVLSVVVFHARFAPSEWRAAWDGFTQSWSNLLTVTAPTVASPSLIAVPVFLAWAATFAGVELGRRTKLSGLPAVPPLVLLVVALAFAGTRPAGTFLLSTAIILTILALMLVRAQRSVARPADVVDHLPILGQARMALAGPGIIAALGLLAVLMGSLLPVGGNERRFDLRARYRPPLDLTGAVTPLAQLDAAINDPSTTSLFTVRFSGVPANVTIDRIPIALLERYDGSVWGTDAEFTQAGRDLPPGPPADTKTATIHQTYKITAAFPTVFLPALERPQSLAGNGMAFDRQAGMLVSAAAGTTALSYSVDSDVPIYSVAAEKAAALRGNSPSTAALVLAPPEGWGPLIENFALQYGKGPNRLAQLDALANELRSDEFGYSKLAPTGQSLGVLDKFLSPATTNPQTANNRLGSAEQFASAFAVLARALNTPSRVVVGYQVPAAAVRAGQTIAVRPQDMYAWAEVNLAGLGWVPFDLANSHNRPVRIADTQAPPVTTSGGNDTPPTTVPVKRPLPKHHHHNAWPWIEVLLALGVALPGGIVLAKRGIRAFRRGYGPPARRIFGAWLDTRDQLCTHKVDATRWMTVKQVADGCAEHDVKLAEQLALFGPVIDAALYGPGEPPDDSVDAAWHLADTLGATLREGLSPPERLLAAVDPRPLLQSVGKRDR